MTEGNTNCFADCLETYICVHLNIYVPISFNLGRMIYMCVSVCDVLPRKVHKVAGSKRSYTPENVV